MPTNPSPTLLYSHFTFTSSDAVDEYKFIWLTSNNDICKYTKKFHERLYNRFGVLARFDEFLNIIGCERFIKDISNIDYYRNEDYWNGVFKAMIFINKHNIYLKLDHEIL